MGLFVFVQPTSYSSCFAKTSWLIITHRLSAKFFHTHHAYWHHWLPPFYISGLSLSWSQNQCKTNSVGFILSHTFHLMRMKFDMVLKQFRWNICILILSFVYLSKGYNCWFLRAAWKSFNIGMHSDIYELIWSRLGMMTDTTELCISLLCLSDLDLPLGSQGCENAQISQSSQSVWMEFDRVSRLGGMNLILFFVLSDQYSSVSGFSLLQSASWIYLN